MEIYELQIKIREAEDEISDLQAEIERLRQKIENYNRHLALVNRKEEAGESFYSCQRKKVDSVRNKARGKAIESAIREYDELFSIGRWNAVQEDFEAIRAMIQKNINLAESRIEEAQRRIQTLKWRIGDWYGDIRRIEMRRREESTYVK